MPAFDQFGRVIRSAPAPQFDIPIRQTPSYNSYRSYSSYSTPWYRRAWEGIDDFVSSIGNFIARNGENFANIIVGIGICIFGLGLVCWVISHWIDDGFLWAILYAFGAVILFGLGSFCFGILSLILQILIAGLRLLFWNAWSFLGVLAVVLVLLCFAGGSSKSSELHNNPVATEISSGKKYRCTASSLFIRTTPNKNGTIMGKLKKGETTTVYETTSNGYAKISFQGKLGYASMSYLDEL